MKKNNAFRRAAALLAALSITVSLAAPAFADIYYIDDGDITITKDEHGQTVQQNGTTKDDSGEIIITTREQTITTQESDLEGPAAEDSGFGPVVEDNYQPALPEDAEEPKDADQPESTEEPKDADQPEGTDQPEDAEEPKAADRQESTEEPEDADRQESADQQPQQAAPAAAAAPAASTPGNGFCKNIITVINKCADKVLNLTLKDVKIDVSDTGIPGTTIKGKAALSVQGNGNVEIELDGDNELKSGANRAGLEKNTSDSTGTLTLKDDNKEAGSLKATGGENGAGIGGGNRGSGKNITIKGGTVNATGGLDGAGIGGGGGCWGSGEDITIKGGTVTAAGGRFGAGIGGGLLGSGKNITITDGTVNAAGGQFGAGIGGGDRGSGEDITIKGGTVNAAGGLQAAGIGGGNGGGGREGSGKNITITGGTVNTTGGDNGGAGIGGGFLGSGEAITITGGTVNATGTDGAGIGGGDYGSGEDITITGGTVNAAGGLDGAGIGGGWKGSGKNITITGGTVNAAGGNGGSGIGGGDYGSGEDITIKGGTVNAAGGDGGAGIGGGYEGSGSNVTVSGAAQVTAITGKPDWVGAGATIGNGGSSTQDSDGNTVPTPGTEIQADIKGLTTGYIHHIIYEQDGTTIKKEWWEPERTQPKPESPQPNPEDPNAPAEESNEVDLGTPGLHVETLEGSLLPFDARQQGSTLRVTSDNLAARLHGTRQALEALREQGVEQIQFVTTLKTTTLPVAELLAEGGSWFALEHNGLVSRRLSAAQAESLKCWMR